MDIILFRADSSSKIGTGHIMRDLVLAKEFKYSNITFATQNLEGNINHKIIEAGYKIETLESNSFEELNPLIKNLNIDMIIIDHYNIDFSFEEKLKTDNPNLKIFVFDDTYEKHYCDILLNHNIYADENIYKEKKLVPESCEIRCGSKYTLIRDEFVKEKQIKREKKYDFLVAMGGADTSNITTEILKRLPLNKKIAVITTSANANLLNLRKYINLRNNIDLFIDSNEIAKLINSSKFAIVTPSVIVHEVLYLNVPFLAIKTAENQKYMVSFLKTNNYKVIEDIGDLNDIKGIFK